MMSWRIPVSPLTAAVKEASVRSGPDSGLSHNLDFSSFVNSSQSISQKLNVRGGGAEMMGNATVVRIGMWSIPGPLN